MLLCQRAQEEFRCLLQRLKPFSQGQHFPASLASHKAIIALSAHLPHPNLMRAVKQRLEVQVKQRLEPMMRDVLTRQDLLGNISLQFCPDIPHGTGALPMSTKSRTKLSFDQVHSDCRHT